VDGKFEAQGSCLNSNSIYVLGKVTKQDEELSISNSAGTIIGYLFRDGIDLHRKSQLEHDKIPYLTQFRDFETVETNDIVTINQTRVRVLYRADAKENVLFLTNPM